MSRFHPKNVFRQAREAEASGRKKTASAHYATLSSYLRHKGKIEEAKTLILRAITLSADSPRLYLQLALCEMAVGDESAAEGAVQDFTRVALERQKAEEYRPYLEEALKEYPGLRQIHYERLLELDRTTAAPFIAQAQTFMERGQWAEAQKVLLDALKTKTQDAEVLLMLRRVLESRGAPEEVTHVRRFEQGKMPRTDFITLMAAPPRKSPPSPPLTPPREDSGFLVVEEEAPEKNLQVLIRELESEIGVELSDGVDTVAPLVAEFRRRSQKVLAGKPRARLDMALAYFGMGLVEEAREEIKEVGPSDPLYPEAMALHGEILVSEGSDLGALDSFQRVLRDERRSPEMAAEALYQMIQIYVRLGDFGQALATIEKLEKKHSDYRSLRTLKMHVLEKAGPEALAAKRKRAG